MYLIKNMVQVYHDEDILDVYTFKELFPIECDIILRNTIDHILFIEEALYFKWYFIGINDLEASFAILCGLELIHINYFDNLSMQYNVLFNI